MLLKMFKTERKYNAGNCEFELEDSFKRLSNVAKDMLEGDWYMAVFQHENSSEVPFARFTKNGGEFFYFSKELVGCLNILLTNILNSSGFHGSRTVLLEDKGDGYHLTYRSRENEVRPSFDVSISDDDLRLLSRIDEYVKRLGFTGMECILFAPRRVGKYKSACASPSKTEKGHARITIDIH